MDFHSWRVQWRLAALGYAMVLAAATALLYGRHLQELQNPVDAAGGMWAAGDMFLYGFIACMFMVPTVLLILVTAKFEVFYTAYCKFLLALSLTTPVCLGLVNLGEIHVGEGLVTVSLCRLICSPLVLVAMGTSRFAARFDRAKRFASYSLLIEGLTFVIAVVLLIHAGIGPK